MESSLKISDIEEKLKKVKDSGDEPRKSSSDINYPAIKNAEKALEKLIKKFPNHKSLDEVYLKVTAINSLYSTNIYDTYKMAYHIFKNVNGNIDDRLEQGDPQLIADIASGHGIKNKQKEEDIENEKKDKHFYSFATKYCSFHNSNKYAIYDMLIQDLLIKFYKGDKEINYGSLRDYKKFMGVINKFREDNNLESLTLKQIDMYLWLEAKEVEQKKNNKKLLASEKHR